MAMTQDGFFLLVLKMELVPPINKKTGLGFRLIITLSVVFNTEESNFEQDFPAEVWMKIKKKILWSTF